MAFAGNAPTHTPNNETKSLPFT